MRKKEIRVGEMFDLGNEPMFVIVEFDRKWVTVLSLAGIRKIEIGYFKEHYLENA
jgi:hypothetical protein